MAESVPKRATGGPSDEVPGRKDGSIYSTEKAEAVIKPVLAEVQGIIESRADPHIDGSLNRLNMWMLRMEKGNTIDDRTPFFKSLSRESVIKELTNRVEAAASHTINTPTFDKYAKVWSEVEADQAKNIGPQSMFLPWTLDGPDKLAAVMSDKKPTKDLNWAALEKACEWVAQWLPKGKIHATSIQETLTGMGGQAKFALDTTTNSGYPSWVREWFTKTETKLTPARRATMEYVLSGARALYETAFKTGDYKSVVTDWIGTASQRTVSKGKDPLKPNKDGKLKSKRIVIAMPKVETIAGKTIMAPLQEALARVRNPSSRVRIIPAWSSQPVLDKNIQTFLEYAAARGRVPLSGDISAFDATLPPFIMWMAAKTISTWLDKPTAALFLGIMYSDIYRTSVICPSKIFEACPSSVKSGSIFTSLIGCVANALIQAYGMFAGYYRIEQMCVMGDDFILDGPGVEPESIERSFADMGMECNASKQMYEKDCVHFLQRLHCLGLPGGQGSIYRIGGGILSVEDDTQLRWDERNKFTYIFQALARLENAAFNPDYELLVQFVSQGDERYHLGRSYTPDQIARNAGSYAERKMMEGSLKPWKAVGSGVPFVQWSVNRVLRGEKLPPPGKARFAAVYMTEYDKVQI